MVSREDAEQRKVGLGPRFGYNALNQVDHTGEHAMVDPELLKILVCPENKTPVTPIDDALIAKVNAAIDAGTLKNRAGEVIKERIDGGLKREDGAYLYAIRDDIPIMLIDEAIPLSQLG